MKKCRLMLTALFAMLFSSMLHATIYADAQSGTTTNWVIYDQNPAGATIENVDDSVWGSRVIQFIGNGIKNGYKLGDYSGRSDDWNNQNEFSIRWSMNFSQRYVIYVRVETTDGYRFLYYTKSDIDKGKKDRYIHHGLGADSANGEWQTFVRDLEADLKEFEPNNELVSVNAFLVRGSGKIDNIELFDDIENQEFIEYDDYTLYEDAQNGDSAGWSIYDKNPSGASIKNVYDTDKMSRVIEVTSSGIRNGFKLGNRFGKVGAWENSEQFNVSWSMNTSQRYVVYLRVQTTDGYRYLYYTRSDTDRGKKGRYIHHGLGADSANGEWQTFVRDLEADLKEFEPNNSITSVNAFMVRGNGRFDDILLFSQPDETQLNTPPIAVDQNLTTSKDVNLSIILTGSDVDVNTTLSFSLLTQPTNGELNGTAPNLIYTPDVNYTGVDSFTFMVNDGIDDSQEATVNITIVDVVVESNTPPIAIDQNVTVAEDTNVTIDLEGSDDGNTSLTFTIVTNPVNGTLSGTAPEVVYIPNADYFGIDSFTFTVSDANATSEIATVNITVTDVAEPNTPPVAQAQNISMDKNGFKTITLSATDSDDNNLTYSIVDQPSNGLLDLDGADVTYTPNRDYTGIDSFTFKAYDGSEYSQLATVNITVNDIAPVVVTTQTIYEDGSKLANWNPSENSASHIGTISESNGTIKISATDKSARYILYKDSSHRDWDNTTEFIASWDLKTDARYEMMFLVQTQNSGEVYIVYSNTAPVGETNSWDANDGLWKNSEGIDAGWGKYSYITLQDTSDDTWQNQQRDLVADLHQVSAFADDEIVSVKYALVLNWDKGKDVYVDNIMLTSSATITEPTPDSNLTKGFDDIKALTQKAIDGTLNGVKYIVIGDSIRVGYDNVYDTKYLFLKQQEVLEDKNITAISYSEVGLHAKGWSNEDNNLSINEPTWQNTLERIAGDGNSTILDISLGLNDVHFDANLTSEELKSYLAHGIDKILEAKPNTLVMLTMPYAVIGTPQADAKTLIYKKAYEDLALEKGLPLINLVDETSFDVSNYRDGDMIEGDEYSLGYYMHLKQAAQEEVANLILGKILP